MSASMCDAIAKPSRMYIPDEYVRTGRSMKRSSSVNSMMSSRESRIFERFIP